MISYQDLQNCALNFKSIDKGDFNLVKQYLVYLYHWAPYFPNTNIHIILKPKVRFDSHLAISDFQIVLNAKLKALSISKNIENLILDLQEWFKQIRLTPLLHQGDKSKCYQIHIKLTRTKKSSFCFGKACFQNAKEYPIATLYRISCCDFHLFCTPCLRESIAKKLSANPYDKKIKCPACELIGDEKEKYILAEEIKKIIPIDEYNMYFQREAFNYGLITCKSGYEFCPYKNVYMKEEYFVKFARCDDIICRPCYAYFLENYINSKFQELNANPKNTLAKGFSFLCYNYHEVTSGEKNIDDVQQILKYSPSSNDRKYNVQKILADHYDFFCGLPVVYCEGCRQYISQIRDRPNECTKCFKCLDCGESLHPGIDCKQYTNISNILNILPPMKQRPITETDPDYKDFLKSVELLKEYQLQYKIITYSKPTISGVIKYHNDILLERFPSINHMYFLSKPYENPNEASDTFYNGIQLDENKCVRFPKTIKNTKKNCSFIIYKGFFTEALKKTALAKDVTEEPKLFIDDYFNYITNIHAVVPFMVINTEPYD
jgi:hypothetical protein